MNYTIDLPNRAESYAFWSSWWEHSPNDRKKAKKIKALNFRTAKESDLLSLNRGECPFCGGAEYVPFSRPIKSGHYTSEHVLCACMLLRIAEEKSKLESFWTPRKLADINPLAKPNAQAAEYTRFIKTTAATFIKELGEWVYLYGGFGSGKTHVLEAVKTQLRGLALFINTADLTAHIYEATANHNLGDLLDEISGAPVLLLDDFGVEHGTDYLYSALYAIINNRYARRLAAPTFITSNLTQEDLKKSPNENLRRIATRLGDNQLVIPLVSTQVDFRSLT